MNIGPEPGPSSHHDSRSRARDFAGISTRELTKLLAAQEREARNLERSLAGVNAQMQSEAERASAAETRTREIGRRLRGVMDARRVAEQDTTRAQEELKLYKIQLQAAAREIEHAQSVLDAVEKDRVRAEEDAANSRDVARRIKEEHLIEMAREEGRRLGLAEGLRRGKQTGFTEGRDSAIQEHGTQQAQDDAAAAEETRKQEEDLRRRQEELARQMEQNDRQREEDIRRQEDEDRARRADEDARRQREDEDARRREREEDEHARNEIHPVIVHNEPPTIHHPRMQAPPDGWVPHVTDPSHMAMAIPPPHEFEEHGSPFDHSGYERPASAEPLMVPPRIHIEDDDGRPTWNSSHHRDPRRRRPSSPESDSTTFSQLDLISPPEEGGPPAGTRRHHRMPPLERELSDIPEASPAAHVIYRRPSLEPDYNNASESPTPSPSERPLHTQTSSSSDRGTPPSRHSSRRDRNRGYPHLQSPDTSDNSLTVPQLTYARSNSSLGSVAIDVVPPSRPASHASNRQGAFTPGPGFNVGGSLLSPQDAVRELPPIADLDEPPAAASAPIPVPTFAMVAGGTSPMMGPSSFLPTASGGPGGAMELAPGGLPLGFVPSTPAAGTPGGFPQASPHLGQAPAHGWVPEGLPTTMDSIPANYRPPTAPPTHREREREREHNSGPSQGQSSQGQQQHAQQQQPAFNSYYAGYAPPPGGYARSRTTSNSKSSRSRPQDDFPSTTNSHLDSDSNSDSEAVSSSLGTDDASLATPPPRAPRTPLRALEDDLTLPSIHGHTQGYHEHGHHADAVYAQAPLPQGVAYPDPHSWTGTGTGNSTVTGTHTGTSSLTSSVVSTYRDGQRENHRAPSVPPVGIHVRPPSAGPGRPPSTAGSVTSTVMSASGTGAGAYGGAYGGGGSYGGAYGGPGAVPARPTSAAGSAARSSRTARSAGSAGTRAAGVALPPSVAGSDIYAANTPKSHGSYGSRLDSITERPRGDPRGGGGSGLGGGGGSAAGSGSVRSSRRSGRDRYAVPESPDED